MVWANIDLVAGMKESRSNLVMQSTTTGTVRIFARLYSSNSLIMSVDRTLSAPPITELR
jgi:hypothetical protein